MKTLILVRHAESAPGGLALADRERPLNGRGLHDATAMGRRLAERGVKPDRLVSSPALRALTTARLFADALGFPHQRIVVDDGLYAASARNVLERVRSFDDACATVIVFGHNPALSDLARRLAGQPIAMSPCTVVEVGYITGAWSDIGTQMPAHTSLDAPRP